MLWAEALLWPSGRTGAGWEGVAPAWGAQRPEPAGLQNLMQGRQLRLIVLYPEGFPMVPADLYPVDPEVPADRRTQQRWHVNGDGSLCMTQRADDWQPSDTAADLVLKASGWFIEYLLIEGGDLDAMTKRGIYVSDELDALIAARFA
ncbi:MAG: hypothetical protein ACLQMH_07500 [Solirubrobacteraceae bacterium]